MSETATAVQLSSACQHSEAVGTRWGDPISEERQSELDKLAEWQREWEAKPEAERGDSIFEGVRLTGAEVFWLAARALAGPERDLSALAARLASSSAARLTGSDVEDTDYPSLATLHLERTDLTDVHLEGAFLYDAHLEGANLSSAYLENAYLSSAYLENAYLISAHLENANLTGAHLENAILDAAHLEAADLEGTHLEKANLSSAHLEGADLQGAHLEGADLGGAYLENASLFRAHLEGANLSIAHLKETFLGGAHLEGAYLRETDLGDADFVEAHLEGADLSGAHLERADLSGAFLEGADLTRASFDKTSRLNEAVLTGAMLDQVTFDNTNLTVVDWSHVGILGDELAARNGKRKDRQQRLDGYKAAVRANRVLAVALQAQGLREDATRFAYRSEVMQRRVLFYQRKPGAYLFSVLLAVLAGYGYRLWRIAAVYGSTVLLFALGYLGAGILASQGQSPTGQKALDALQISLNAIHGRVFFAQFGLDTLQSWLATGESIVGIVIEGTFVAMLIQRFFGR